MHEKERERVREIRTQRRDEERMEERGNFKKGGYEMKNMGEISMCGTSGHRLKWPANILADTSSAGDGIVDRSGDANANSADDDDSAHPLGQHVPSSSSSFKTQFLRCNYSSSLLLLNGWRQPNAHLPSSGLAALLTHFIDIRQMHRRQRLTIIASTILLENR